MIYFISDIHLGLPNFKDSLQREKKLITWLNKIQKNASEIFFLGDVFEFWYEWKDVIPKHYSRFFGKLTELSDNNIKLHFFTGNHDIWAYNYFTEEFNMKIYRKPQKISLNGKKFYLAHGDGLGPGDKSYKILKKIFTNKPIQWCFSNLIHPNLAFKIARKISFKRNGYNKKTSFKKNNEWLVQHAKNVEKNEHFNYYIFGHRHIAVDYKINNDTKMIILGDWIKLFTYAVFDGEKLILKKLKHTT